MTKENIHQGYLVLADISGFTTFMENTEIVHSSGILHDLINLIMKELHPLLRVAEVEGDAVFAYAPESAITRGELLMELIESTYAAFRDRRKNMQHNATCPCRACQSISGLDLKFIIHFGDYVLQHVTGKQKPVGPSVNMAHRLLKNSLSEATGWRAYALFSETGLAKMGLQPEGMQHSAETYENLGTIQIASYNLDERYNLLLETRNVLLTAPEADYTLHYTFAAEPPVVWDWLTDPDKRNRWGLGSAWESKKRASGRTGPSAQNHCTKSGALEEILDWRPFEYYTVRLSKGRHKMLISSMLAPDDAGTQVHWHLKYTSRLPQWLSRRIGHMIATRVLRLQEAFALMAGLMAQALEDVPEPPLLLDGDTENYREMVTATSGMRPSGG